MVASQSWIKAHTSRLTDPRILRLTDAQFGIWMKLQLMSRSQSDSMGYFVKNDRAMSLEDIGLSLQKNTEKDREELSLAFSRFMQPEIDLVRHADGTGYELTDWATEQSGTANEGREKWRERKRRERDRKAEKDRAEASEVARLRAENEELRRRGESKVTELRR